MDQKDLLMLIDKLGFERKVNGRGHYTVHKNGRRIATIPKSPSDHRATKNGIAALRRAGVKIPRH